jgi:hypothetical protein
MAWAILPKPLIEQGFQESRRRSTSVLSCYHRKLEKRHFIVDDFSADKAPVQAELLSACGEQGQASLKSENETLTNGQHQ